MDAIATTQKVLYVGGVATELCFMEFADRFMVVVTQLNKPGTLVRRPARTPSPRCSDRPAAPTAPLLRSARLPGE
jgi:hypothetical protein|eukprot:COSAG02_NODE_21139_length_800_cov_1.253923_2_plen_75_part_00